MDKLPTHSLVILVSDNNTSPRYCGGQDKFHLVSDFLGMYRDSKNQNIRVLLNTPYPAHLNSKAVLIVYDLLKNGNHLDLRDCFVTDCFCQGLTDTVVKLGLVSGTLEIGPSPTSKKCRNTEADHFTRMMVLWALQK